MNEPVRDLRQSLRRIRRHPGVAAVVVFTLTLGIGANTAIFSVARSVLLRPLAYAASDRLVALFTHETKKGEARNPSSPADYLAWKKDSRGLTEMTAAHPWSPVLTGRGQPEPIPALKATPELFVLLGVDAALGHAFAPTAAEDAGDVVVLSHRLWQRRLGGDPGIVGQSLNLDGKPYTVVGVMPPPFRFPPFWMTDAEMWTPLRFTAGDVSNDARFLRVFARLAPETVLAQAQSEMKRIGDYVAQARPAAHVGTAVSVEALREPVVSRVRPALLVLLGAVSLLLLIACANVASLLLAEGVGREAELTLRAALGARRSRLVRQLLVESVGLALVGGLAGLWLASAGVEALRVLLPVGFPRLAEIRLDGWVAAYSVGLSLVTGILAGLMPAFRLSRVDLTTAMKRGDRRAGAGGRHWLHDVLIVTEFALALVLLIGAGLMTKSFVRLVRPQPGFRIDRLLTMTVSLSSSPVGEAPRQAAFFDELLGRVRGVPGVVNAALVNHLPVGGDTWGTGFTVEGQTAPVDDPPSATFRVATAGYFRTMGIPLVRGRSFNDDDRADSAAVVLVNETLARRYWPEGDAVGRRIRSGGAEAPGPWLTVVGVVGDTRQASLTDEVRPEVVFPYPQNPVAWFRSTTLVVETAAEPRALAEAVSGQISALAPDLPITRVHSMAEVLSEAVGQERFNALLLGSFALAALLLAAVGIYGVMAYTVSRRRHEVGVRMALGASASEVFRMVVGRGLSLSAWGAGLGLLAACGLSRLLAQLLFGVSPTDPPTFIGITLVLVAVSVAACAGPAWRAARIDPLAALRDE